MKIRKIGFLIIMGAIIVSSIQVNPIQAQEEGDTSTFGLDIANPATVEKVDGGVGEPNNYWVHKNGLMWSEVQKDGPISNWNVNHVTGLDNYIETVSAAGMEMILVIRSTPTWAQKYPGYSCGPMSESSIDEFADFVNETVTRYSQPPFNVRYYEIWNEPDDIREDDLKNKPYGCWAEPYDEQAFGGGYYGQMLKQVYPALKTASTNAQLVIGGLLLPADPEDAFWSQYVYKNEQYEDGFIYANMSKFFKGILEECYTNGEGKCFDIVNFHGYTNYAPNSSIIQLEKLTGTPPYWEERGGVVAGKLAYLRELMSEYGVNKPVILTEAAMRGRFVPDYDPVFEASKADYVVWLYTRNMAKGIYATTWYHLDNYGWDRSGLLDRDNNPLPAYHAYTVLTDMLDGAVYQRDIYLGDGILGFEFIGDTTYWVLFSEDGETKTINKDELPLWYHSVVDLFGNKIDLENDKINFNRPIYIKADTALTAVPDLYILNEGAPITVRAPGVLLNDIYYGGDALEITEVTDPSFGELSMNPDGSFTYTPTALPFPGEDSFTYRMSDGTFDSNTATVTILDGMWLFLPFIHR